MKSARDPRHQKRRLLVQYLFANIFHSPTDIPTEEEDPGVALLAKEIVAITPELDIQISEAAPAWPVNKLNRIDLAILRLAVYELKKAETPPKVIIDEAVELAKEFGSESSPSFINGVLGTILKKVS
jgi:N utilization substance protein B